MKFQTIHIIQLNTEWEKPAKNLVRLSNMLEYRKPSGGIIVLPEMFTTGFTDKPNGFAEMMQGETIEWMQSSAYRYSCFFIGSIIISENNQLYNRMLCVSPEGSIQYYDKHHLFRMGSESTGYTAGTDRKLFQAGGIKIMPQICYDLRFPVWSRNDQNYDVLINVANWPAVRNPVWEILLKARAIENQCYVIGANRVGNDGKGIIYIGNSMVIDPSGEVLLQAEGEENIFSIDLNLEDLYTFRKKFPVLQDRDQFNLNM